MTKQKGVTPIIAILVILLITIAIAGSAWVYISTYFTGMTREAIEITSVDCLSTGATIYIHNIGTDTIATANIKIDRIVVSGNCVNSTGDVMADKQLTWVPATEVGPGDIVTMTDEHCCRSTNVTAVRYTIIAGGRVQKVTINC